MSDDLRPDVMIDGVIPLLDVGPYLAGEPGALQKLGRELRYAFERVGFYYMRGHGVPPQMIASMFAAARRFHAQPLDWKLRLRIDEHNIGYMGMGGSMFRTSQVQRNTKPSDNEAFFLRRERSPDDPDVIANKKLRGLNQWPSDLPGFKEIVLAYMKTMEDLGRRLVRVYAVALDLPPTYFDPMFEQPSLVQRLTHYPARPQREEDEFSIAPHTDSGFMTMLAPNDMPGLSIRLPNGEWIDAPVVEDAYVVNGGDILKRWTNDRFLSTPHRVINVTERSRYAVPFFFDPHFETQIVCLPTCRTADNPPKYPAITYEDYAIWFAMRNYEHQNHAATSEKVDAGCMARAHKGESIMKVVTLKNIPEVPAPGAAEPTDGYAGPVHRTRQTIIESGESANFNCSIVNFSQGCNTGWHIHDCDQILIVTSGSGWVATETDRREIKVGDVAHVKAGERHWHGAKADTTMGHITITLASGKATWG